MSKAAAKSGLKRGDAVVIKDRLWGFIQPDGKLVKGSDGEPAIYSSLVRAKEELFSCREWDDIEGAREWRIIRLNDVTGTVV